MIASSCLPLSPEYPPSPLSAHPGVIEPFFLFFSFPTRPLKLVINSLATWVSLAHLPPQTTLALSDSSCTWLSFVQVPFWPYFLTSLSLPAASSVRHRFDPCTNIARFYLSTYISRFRSDTFAPWTSTRPCISTDFVYISVACARPRIWPRFVTEPN